MTKREYNLALGRRLLAVRRDLGLYQEYVASNAGLEPSALSQMELHGRQLTPANLLAVINVLGVTLDELAAGIVV